MANNWAIVIGINDYLHHPERSLNYAVNDAQQMGNFLSNQASFGAERITLCLGDEAHRGSSTYPTCSNLLRLLKRDLQPDRLGKIDHLWFYFSGHGVSRNGRDYLITSDCLEDEIERFGLPIDEVIAALQLHKNADIVLILDACRQILGTKSFDNPIGKQTVNVAKERGITTIFSCAYGQYSYELEALQQGAFTYALIEGLSQYTLPHQLETYLQQRVPALIFQHRGDRFTQTPHIRIESASKAFRPLIPGTVTSVDITVFIDQATEAELEEDFETAKHLWWQVIEVSQCTERIRAARTALNRIDGKIARLGGDHSVSEPSESSTEAFLTSTASSEKRTGNSMDDNQLSTTSLPIQGGSFTDGLAGLQELTGVDLSRPQLITSKQAGMAAAYALKMKLAAENAKKFYKAASDVSTYSTSYTDQVPLSHSMTTHSPNLHTFEFEIVTINAQGKEMNYCSGQAEFFVENLGDGITLEMVKIPGGSFKMGSPQTEQDRSPDESPQHQVTVPTFFMGKFAVTQAQYQAIMGSNPARFKNKNHPVENVSWNDAVEFCAKLSQQTGNIYRLPSEAEWEYACRARTETPFHFGETITGLLANYDAQTVYRLEPEGKCRQQTTEVGTFPPNAFGLYDMHGNVWEWCQDHWHDNYQGAPVDGRAWADDSHTLRLIRGGSWNSSFKSCRSAYRNNYYLVNRYEFLGFRVVCLLA